MTDGASAVLVVSEAALKTHGLTPIARASVGALLEQRDVIVRSFFAAQRFAAESRRCFSKARASNTCDS